MFHHQPSQSRAASRGFGALAYILMSIALLASITSAMSIISRNNNKAQQTDIAVSQIYSQAAKIRSDILLCMTESNRSSSGVGPSAYQRFPACNANPPGTGGNQLNADYAASGYCTNVSTSNNLFANARNLRCLAPADRSVWDNAQGDFYPERINGFEEWKYTIVGGGGNAGLQGVSLMISTTPDASGQRTPTVDNDYILRQVAKRFGNIESRLAQRNNGVPVGDWGAAGTAAGAISNVNCTSPCLANTLIVWLAR